MRYRCYIGQVQTKFKYDEQLLISIVNTRAVVVHSLTSALDGGGWSAPRLGHFTPRDRRLGGPQSRSERGVISVRFK
jgi:hypothetical protein